SRRVLCGSACVGGSVATLPAPRRLGRHFPGRGIVLRSRARKSPMCRSIKTLFNFAPPATDDEVRAASLQFVRKLSGFTAPSKANEAAFNRAVGDVFEVARTL